MHDEDAAVDEQVPEGDSPKPPKAATGRRRKGSATTISTTVGVLLDVPKPIHDELKRLAIRSRVSMKRLLLESFVDILAPETAHKLRALLGPMKTEGRFKQSVALSERNAMGRCDKCFKAHPNMPGYGPWHEQTCAKWRIRPTVMSEDEEGA